VILVIGKRGSGKSALGYRLLELYRPRATPYVVGLPPQAQKLLPEWVGVVGHLEDVPHGAVVLLDEAYMTYHARASMTSGGRTIGQAVNLSRQRGHSLIFIVQEARQLDVNIISQADVLAVKELSELSRGFERRELSRLTDQARVAFADVRGDKRRWTWVYTERADFTGMVENTLASFWRPALSHAFANTAGVQQENQPPSHRNGARTPREDLVVRAKGLISSGHSYGKAAQAMGLPRSTVWDLVNRG
jgi:hypothetical protein